MQRSSYQFIQDQKFVSDDIKCQKGLCKFVTQREQYFPQMLNRVVL